MHQHGIASGPDDNNKEIPVDYRTFINMVKNF